ncbi:MAG: glutamate racemase [Chloroflexi bacterium]|nr:glutamate racemase [Chloroflexota bacterium]MDA1146556.1 glutamate racemase [Chloroflexota bacterium]
MSAPPPEVELAVLAHVGIFDSGLGGLTVARALRARAPALPILYLGDTACFPYGGQSPAELEARVLVVGQSLVDRGCTALVVACNTATSAALERLRAELPVPVIGMEPPLKPAAEQTKSRRVIVLATAGTAAGERFARLEADHAVGVTVHTVPMPGLADLIEAGRARDPQVLAMLEQAIREPIALGADAVALGCTHYGFVAAPLRTLLPEHVAIIDAADAVARRTLAVLEGVAQHVTAGAVRPVDYDVTGDRRAFAAAVDCLRDVGETLPALANIRRRLATVGS